MFTLYRIDFRSGSGIDPIQCEQCLGKSNRTGRVWSWAVHTVSDRYLCWSSNSKPTLESKRVITRFRSKSWTDLVNSCSHYASVNSKHQHPPPRATPGVLHSTAAPGPGFILDDLPRGPGFCISIKLRLVQWKSILSLNWHLDHTSMRFIGSSDLVF